MEVMVANKGTWNSERLQFVGGYEMWITKKTEDS